jgi:hypothetical protein
VGNGSRGFRAERIPLGRIGVRNRAEEAPKNPIKPWNPVTQPDGHGFRPRAERGFGFKRCSSEGKPFAPPIDGITDRGVEQPQIKGQAGLCCGAIKPNKVRHGNITIANRGDEAEQFISPANDMAPKIIACRAAESGQEAAGQSDQPDRGILMDGKVELMQPFARWMKVRKPFR